MQSPLLFNLLQLPTAVAYFAVTACLGALALGLLPIFGIGLVVAETLADVLHTLMEQEARLMALLPGNPHEAPQRPKTHCFGMRFDMRSCRAIAYFLSLRLISSFVCFLLAALGIVCLNHPCVKSLGEAAARWTARCSVAALGLVETATPVSPAAQEPITGWWQWLTAANNVTGSWVSQAADKVKASSAKSAWSRCLSFLHEGDAFAFNVAQLPSAVAHFSASVGLLCVALALLPLCGVGLLVGVSLGNTMHMFACRDVDAAANLLGEEVKLRQPESRWQRVCMCSRALLFFILLRLPLAIICCTTASLCVGFLFHPWAMRAGALVAKATARVANLSLGAAGQPHTGPREADVESLPVAVAVPVADPIIKGKSEERNPEIAQQPVELELQVAEI